MTDLYITRHGETEWNIEGRFQGRGNSELTQRGLKQARELGRVLDSGQIDLILTSPLKRAQETARLAKGDREIPVIVLDSLSEFDLGDWEGVHLLELARREPENYHNYWNDPFKFIPAGGESYPELIQRMAEAMEEVYALADTKRAVVITHGMALMAILHIITGTDFKKIMNKPVLAQTSITKVKALEENDEIIYEVEYIGDTSHLDADTKTPPIAIKRSEE